MALTANDFDYVLDPELIAQEPAAQRDQSRLMVLRRPGQVSHHVFADLPSLLRPGDLLVLNDTRVVPARFFCRRRTGGRIEGLFLHCPQVGQWEVLLRNAGRCRPGETINLVGPREVVLTLTENRGEGNWLVDVHPPLPAGEILAEAGQTPLPPYIRRPSAAPPSAACGFAEPSASQPPPPNSAGPLVGSSSSSSPSSDRARYQTVYAARDGAVAAPTAGLHFTESLLAALAGRGIAAVRVTLHVGLGTFLPVKVDDLAGHAMHREWYDLPAATAEAINAARNEGRRVIAVGTTSVRVLESVAAVADERGRLAPASGWTDIFIYPPARFRAVDALITNFHLPRSTLLMLVAAFCSPGTTDGVATILSAYAQAQRQRYRFYSYGDAMLIE